MPRTEIRELVAQLRQELEDPFSLDDASLELLIQARDDIEQCLELSSEVACVERKPTIMGKLRAATDSLQTGRPGLTRTVNNLLEVLAGMGI